MATATQTDAIIQQLIATYRDLNTRVRNLSEDRLRLRNGDKPSVRSILILMRDDELAFAQALKERLTGVPMPEIFENEKPVIGNESTEESTQTVISQFGTARATTLTLLRGLTEAQWNESIEGGEMTILGRVQELIASDAEKMEQINGLLGAP
jgi:hypothetical protein